MFQHATAVVRNVLLDSFFNQVVYIVCVSGSYIGCKECTLDSFFNQVAYIVCVSACYSGCKECTLDSFSKHGLFVFQRATVAVRNVL